jgi:uncharacterized phage-associated protein
MDTEYCRKPDFDEEKATEVAACLLELSGEKKKHKWLIKMLYLVERESFERYERPIIYDTLASLPQGQIVSNTYTITKEPSKHSFWNRYIAKDRQWCLSLRSSRPPLKKLSPADVGVINDVFDRFGQMDEDELGEYTHNLPEYQYPGTSSIQTSYERLLSKMGYSDSDVKRVVGEIRQEAILDSLFG